MIKKRRKLKLIMNNIYKGKKRKLHIYVNIVLW